MGSASVSSHGATVAMSIGISTMIPTSAARFRTSGANRIRRHDGGRAGGEARHV